MWTTTCFKADSGQFVSTRKFPGMNRLPPGILSGGLQIGLPIQACWTVKIILEPLSSQPAEVRSTEQPF